MAEPEQDITEYLTFTLGREVFALGIASVREVLEVTDLTVIPRTPEFMRGVINLRGSAVPVMDMRMKFGMSKSRETVDTCIIIAEVDVGGEKSAIGGLVDSVREVLHIPESAVEPAPPMGAAVDTRYIKGMARVGEEFIILVDMGKVFSADELVLAGVGPAANAAEAPA
jgi:purine-binding chemotaxis protein CheW